MAYWYTDVATNQQQGVNFPGMPGEATMTTQPGTENNPMFEGPPEIVATYTWTGNEAANDIINIAIAPAGTLVSPNGKVASGLTAPSSTLTFSIGDNDLSLASVLPITNPQAVVAQPAGFQAPLWVSGTAYVRGNVVLSPNSVPTNQTFTCISATTSSTVDPLTDTVHFVANHKRYSNSIDVSAAQGNVAFANGTQLYGGVASKLPESVTPNAAPGNLTAGQLANQPYQIQRDCWIQAKILTINTVTLNANAVSVFRIGLNGSN